MSIIYAAVCENRQNILCSYTELKNDFDSAIKGLFKHIEPNSRGSFEYADQYMIFTWDEQGYTFIAMCGKDYPAETAFVFLRKVMEEFPKGSKSPNMKPKLQKLFSYYNDNKEVPEDKKIAGLKEGLLSMKNQVLEANDLLGERGEKLQLMIEKSDALKEDSQSFYNVSKKVKRNVLWKKIRWIILGVVLVIIILLIILIKAGVFSGDEEKSKNGENKILETDFHESLENIELPKFRFG